MTRKSDFIYSFLANGFNFGIGIILLPLVLKSLSPAEIGLWYIFIGINGVSLLLDAALSPSIARNASYAWAGAFTLVKDGLTDKRPNNSEPNLELLRNVFYAGKIVYNKLSLWCFLTILLFGSIYIYIISKDIITPVHIVAWFVFVAGIFFNIKYGIWTSMLRGVGFIKEGQTAVIISKLVQLILTVVGLFFFKNILVLSLAFLLSGFILRYICSYYFSKNIPIEEKTESKKELVLQIKDIIIYNSNKVFLWSLGNFIVANFGLFFIAYKINLETSAQYSISLQLYSILLALCTTVPYTYVPQLNKLALNQDTSKIKQIVNKSLAFSVFSYALGFVVILYFANPVLMMLKSNVPLLESKYLILVGVLIFLEMIHSIACVFITTFNNIPFAKSSLISGGAVVLFTFLLFNFPNTSDILSVILARAVVQLLFNNWFWPLSLYKKLYT
jgi:O-antigen/teichoic acid export membrane protein